MNPPHPRKPDPTRAMYVLIDQVRNTLPFALPATELCAGPCRGCPKKLLEYIDGELFEWEERLQKGERPTLGDLNRLGKRCRRVHDALVTNGLVKNF